MRPTGTPENLKPSVVGFGVKQLLKRQYKINYSRRQLIDEIGCRGESFVPKFQGYARMGKEGEPYLDYMVMLKLSEAILLMHVWT
jgi:hypothetical protein